MQPDPSDEILSLRASLDESEKGTQQFLNRVVHDLRSVRRAVGISAEILVGGGLSSLRVEELHRTVGHLKDGLTKMDAILSGTSNYSASLRASAYSFTTVPMEMALRLSLAGLEREVRETQAVVRHEDLPQVVGDRDHLTQLFRNLIDNAIKYRGTASPRIEIRAEQAPDYWLFSVRDNGIGIDPKYRDRIFEPFNRLHGSEIPGIGLGLTICRKIVNAHQGTIRVESTLGEGATFLFTLPSADRRDPG